MQEITTPRSSSSGYRSQSSMSSSLSQSVLFQRRRTLDEYPMEHSYGNTVRMFQHRRSIRETQKKNLNSAVGESKKLSSYSRRRFESVLGAKKDDKLPPTNADEASLFYQEQKPFWSQKRHFSISVPQSSPKPSDIPTRPGSEPPCSLKGGRELNHLRATNQAYPQIRKLLQEINSGYRVICTSPEEVCKARRASKDFSVASDFLIVPLQKPQEEDKTEEQLVCEMQRLASEVAENEAHEEEREAKDDDDVDADTSERPDILEDEPIPWRCWVDDATVSSICSKHSDTEHSPEDNPSTAASPAPDQRPALVPEPVPQVLSTPAVVPEKPSSPSVRSGGKRRSASKSGRRKAQPLPEPPVEETPVEVEEIKVEEPQPEPEPEPEPEPVPPSYICPSSESKSHDVEVKMWLRKSSFSAANRTVPIIQ